jgi:hypothetical protein
VHSSLRKTKTNVKTGEPNHGSKTIFGDGKSQIFFSTGKIAPHVLLFNDRTSSYYRGLRERYPIESIFPQVPPPPTPPPRAR